MVKIKVRECVVEFRATRRASALGALERGKRRILVWRRRCRSPTPSLASASQPPPLFEPRFPSFPLFPPPPPIRIHY